MTVSVLTICTVSSVRAQQAKQAGVFGDVRALAHALGISTESFQRVIDGVDIFTDREFADLARHVGMPGADLTDLSVSIPLPEDVSGILWALRRDIVAVMPADSVAEFGIQSPSPVLGYLVMLRTRDVAPDAMFVSSVASRIRRTYGYDTHATKVLRGYATRRAA